MVCIEEELNVLKELLSNNEPEKAYKTFLQLEKDLQKDKKSQLPFLYYEFAFLLFENSFYEDCVVLFNKAYKLNYMKNNIKKFIFNSFITPNLAEFEKSYAKNINKYISSNIVLTPLAYSELKLEFIPVSKDKFYIFDLEKDTFEEFIDLNDQDSESKEKVNLKDNFSDLLILDEYNLNNLSPYLDVARNRIIYYLISVPAKALAFFKIPNIYENYLSNVVIFESPDILTEFFRSRPNTYLPKVIIDKNISKDFKLLINKIIEDEHNSRISHHNSSRNNILLSICIPSWNRGHRALKALTSLLNLNYDAEIEFVVSNNGSTLNTDGYNQIKNIDDSRISYFEFESNQGYLKNVCKVLDLAKGKFALLLSDEDAVNEYALSYFMCILKNNGGIGVIRTGTSHMYKSLKPLHIKCGEMAFLEFFLRNNYISGIIYNTAILNKLKVTKYIIDNSSNISCSLYAHMWIDALMTFEGDFYQDPRILCIEGTSENNVGKNISNIYDELISYAHYKSRIEQHMGFIDLINNLPTKNLSTILSAYLCLCVKTYFLVNIVKKTYIKWGFDWNKICDELHKCCISGIDKLNIDIHPEIRIFLENSINEHHNNYIMH